MTADVAVILVNSHASLLVTEVLLRSEADEPLHHCRTPKALLPLKPTSSKALPRAEDPCLLDGWLSTIRQSGISRIFLVTNGAFYKHFERWATAASFPVDHIINDGTTGGEYAIGPAASLQILQRRIGAELRTVKYATDSECDFGAKLSLGSAVDAPPTSAAGRRWLLLLYLHERTASASASASASAPSASSAASSSSVSTGWS